MKLSVYFLVAMLVSFASCQKSAENIEEAKVVFLEDGPCCSNMETFNGEMIHSDLLNYSESILDAFNISNFDELELERDDVLLIQFTFSDAFSACPFICNRHHGIPISVVSVKKL